MGREVKGDGVYCGILQAAKSKATGAGADCGSGSGRASLHDLEEAYTVVIQEYRHVIKKSGEIITQFRGEVEGSFERF